jgi:predicted RNase H-like nuclease (RuvC/YqgF family)
MSDHLIAEADRHAKALPKMQLPTTQPTHRDIAWYADECADLKKQLASLERENAALWKKVQQLEVEVARLEKTRAKHKPSMPFTAYMAWNKRNAAIDDARSGTGT